jgi:acyl dehydratase
VADAMKLEPGANASLTRRIGDSEIRAFAMASGDDNPVHLDDSYAGKTQFGRRIAHGLLTGSLVSAVLGTILPGEGTIYLSQTFQFKAPVYINDEITAKVELTDYREDRRIAKFRTTCTNQDGALVLDGEAVVIAPNRE